MEIAALPLRLGAREHEHRVVRQGLDHLDVPLALEEEAGRDEHERVGRKPQPRAERALLLRIRRQHRVLQPHHDERHEIALALIAREQADPEVRAVGVDNDPRGQPAHESEDRAVGEEPRADAQGDRERAEPLEVPRVARSVVQGVRELAVVMELLGLDLVRGEHRRNAAKPQPGERAHEGDVAEDPGLVLEDDGVGALRDVPQLREEVRGVEVLRADEGRVVPGRAQPIAHRERVVMDPGAPLARHDRDVAAPVRRQIPVRQRERSRQVVGDCLGRERGELAVPAPDEVFAQRGVAHGALERGRHGVGCGFREEDPRVAKRVGDRPGVARHDRQAAAHRFQERHAEALVFGQRDERRRTAVVGDERGHRHRAGQRHDAVQPVPPDRLADRREVGLGHGVRADEPEARSRIALAVPGERGHHLVHRLLRQDLAYGEDVRPLVRQHPQDIRIGLDVERGPVDDDRHDGRLGEAEPDELLAVVMAVGDAELGDLRELRELLTADLRVSPGMLIEAGEVGRRGDVVIDDRLPVGKLRDIPERVVPHRDVHLERRAGRGEPLEVAPRLDELADLGLRLRREQIGPHGA